jgi:hypothetical protein
MAFSSRQIAAFTVVLTLSLHSAVQSIIQLPKPRINQAAPSQMTVSVLPVTYESLPYFMTLSSASVLSLALWSVFWEPEISCNVVSDWLAPILHIARSFLGQEIGLELFYNVLAIHLPMQALIWLGIFLCGYTKTIQQVIPYLKALEAFMARPSSDVVG